MLLRQGPPQISAGFALHDVLHSWSAVFAYQAEPPAKQWPYHWTPAYANPIDRAAVMQLSTVAPDVMSRAGSARLASSV